MKTVLITGASRGIGLELANQYFSEGWRVIACCRHPKNVPNLKSTMTLKLDVTDDKDIQDLAKHLKNESIDILINNAGISGPVNEEANQEDWLETLKINTIAPIQIAYALLKQSKIKMIANISSIYGSIELNKGNNHYIYRSSKAGLNAVTKCLANELREKGIITVVIHPGSVKTDMNATGRISPQESATGIRKVLSSLSLKDTGSFRDYQNLTLPW